MGYLNRVNKYRNTRVGKYASKREANRAADLHALAKCSQIINLKEQVRFELLPKCGKDRAIVYIADFVYLEWTVTPVTDRLEQSEWKKVVEDVKGFKTPIYRLKKRLMKQLLGIEIREV